MSETATLAPPEPTAPSRQRKPRASDLSKTLPMITARWNSDEQKKKVRLAKLIEDAFDQVPPDGEEDLEADGLGWVANVDWGGMNAGITDGVEIDFNLATQPETYVRLVARDKSKNSKGAFKKLEQLDKEMLDSWSEFEPELQQMLMHRRSLGLGIFHFPYPYGWHFRALHPCNLVLPPRAKLNPAKWPWFAVRSDIDITELLARFENPTEAATLGWQMDSIKKAIEHFAKEGGATLAGQLTSDPEGYIYDLAHNDLAFAQENSMSIPGWTFYVKEFDGSVSEYLATDEAKIGWLFKGERRHKAMEDLISLHHLSLGQGYIERIRGYGVKMLPFHDLENRVLNHAADVTMLGAGMVLEGGEGDDFQRMREDVRIHGPMTFIPAGIKVQQNSFGNPAGGVLALRREFERVGNQRNRAFGGAEYGQRESDETATGARLKWQERNTARTYEISRYYRQLSNLHRIRWLKMTDAKATDRDCGIKEFKELIADAAAQGVTAADIGNIKLVVARTIFGDGDPNNQFLALMDLKEHIPSLPASGQRVFRKMAFQSRLRDPELVAELFGPENPEEDREFMRQRWRYEVENNSFETSDTRQDIQDDDNHLIHCGGHLVYVEEVIMRVDEGVLSEADAVAKIMRTKPHMQAHLQIVGGDPYAQEQVKEIVQRQANVDNRLRQMSQHVQAEQEQQRAQQLEELRNPKPSVKDTEIILTEQAKRASIAEATKVDIELRRERHAEEMRILASGAGLKNGLEILGSAET